MGGVTLPILADWIQSGMAIPPANSVIYRKRDAHYFLIISVFWCYEFENGDQPHNARDLLKVVRSGQRNWGKLESALDQKFGATEPYKWKTPRVITYLGVPAVLTGVVTHSGEGKTYESDTTWFLLNDKMFYIASSTSYPTAPSPPPQARAEREKALRSIEHAFIAAQTGDN